MWNFSQRSELSQQAANVLSGACGLQCGNREVVVLPRVPEWCLVTLGCVRAGTVQLPSQQCGRSPQCSPDVDSTGSFQVQAPTSTELLKQRRDPPSRHIGEVEGPDRTGHPRILWPDRNDTCSWDNHELGLTCRVSKTMKVKPGYLGTTTPPYDVQVRVL
uniref:Uncharacterized protein n=1 Tax=Equus caballus TaxID=9796 RepID=A0A9L0SNG8_HORSE